MYLNVYNVIVEPANQEQARETQGLACLGVAGPLTHIASKLGTHFCVSTLLGFV